MKFRPYYDREGCFIYSTDERFRTRHESGQHNLQTLIRRSADVARFMGLDDLARDLGRGEEEGVGFVRRIGRENPDKITEFLNMYYGKFENEKKDYFPNGAELAKYFEKIMGMDWFNPKINYISSDLQANVDEICDRFRIGRLNAKVERGEYTPRDPTMYMPAQEEFLAAILAAGLDQAHDAAENDIYTVIQEYADSPFLAHSKITQGCSFGYQTCFDAASYTSFLIAKDLPKIKEKYPENPFESLLKVYERGLFPSHIEDGSFVIWYPEVRTGEEDE
jgi:hypothetical protein